MELLLIFAGWIIGFSVAVYGYKKNALPLDEIVSVWAFGAILCSSLFLWGLWYGYWDLLAPSLGRFGTFIAVWVIANPVYYIGYACLLRDSWRWNIWLTTIFAAIKTGFEAVAVFIIPIGSYGNGWHIILTYVSYFIPLLIVWGYHRLVVYLKRCGPR